jgi:Fe-S cluster assembly protein SufD
MSTVTAPHPDVEALLKGSGEASPRSPHWLAALRGRGLERANALSVPTTRDEEWRFTDLSPLFKTAFEPSRGALAPGPADIAPFIVPEAGVRLVFVDGVFARELSALDAMAAGITVTRIAAALDSSDPVIEAHLGRHAGFENELFAALNTAHLRDGALVRIGKGCAPGQPIHLLFVASRAGVASFPRCLAVVESRASCTLIEDYVAGCDGTYFTDAVTEIVLAPEARVRHVKLQREASAAFHIGSGAVVLGKDASYHSTAVTLGARISRHNLTVQQNGEGAVCRIDGLTLLSGRQLGDTHSLIDHAAPNGKSAQLHKTIVGGAAHAVFNGRILVRPGAQLTDSGQQSRNLLLSPRAHVDTKPQLEIFADDVKCAHGATVGQLDAEQLFYLRSRGLSDVSARNLLTYAFGAEVIDRLPVPSLVERLERVVMAETQAAS